MHESALEAARELLANFAGLPGSEAEAPGRVNLIGEHTDYNGGLVLPAALAQRTAVAVRFSDGSRVRGVSREEGAAESELEAPPGRAWLDYVRGVALELSATHRIPRRGFDVAVAGEVPGGSGLSSSAALEVATALALGAAADRPFRSDEALDLARLCQRAESGFVGVPCGILDPFASLLAREGEAILLDCARMTWETVPLPTRLELVIVDTGVRRALREGGYKTRREECEQALESSRGVLARTIATLSEIGPHELPALRGALPSVLYRRVRHVVTENRRVHAFANALRHAHLPVAGEALYGSHASLRDDYEVTCDESDLLVEQSRTLPGVVGARMTGAGWGGCTVHLVESDHAQEVLERLQAGFAARFGQVPRAWRTRPGPGARISG